MRKILFIAALTIFVSACASRSITPDIEEVKVSRDGPSGDCEDMGRVTGTSNSKKTDNEILLRDLRDEAAKKGANFVKVEEYSSYGTSVTGTAFLCR